MSQDKATDWYLTHRPPRRKWHGYKVGDDGVHRARKEHGKEFDYMLQLYISDGLMNWIYDARVRTAENLGVSVHRVTSSLIFEACLNGFLLRYSKLSRQMWADLLELHWRMRGDRKRRRNFMISQDQLERMDAAGEWIEYEFEHYGKHGTVATCALMYYLNVIEPRRDWEIPEP